MKRPIDFETPTAGFTRTPDRDFSPVPGLILRAYEYELRPAAG